MVIETANSWRLLQPFLQIVGTEMGLRAVSPFLLQKKALNCNNEGPVGQLEFDPSMIMYAGDQSARLKQGRGAAGMCSSCLRVPL